MKKLLVVLLAAGAAAAPAAQEPQTPTFRTGVDLVSIDVAVVDGRGQPVEDLRAPEFSVRIDGEPRRVVTAELVKVDVEAARRQAEDRTETFFTTNMTPPNGRLIVLAIDQLNIPPSAIKPVMSAASKFLDQLSPLDQVALFTYPEPGPRVSFTNDKLRLRLAMEQLIGHPRWTSVTGLNIGDAEAIAIAENRDQIVLAEVLARECRSTNVQQRAQCERDVVDESSQISLRVRQNAEQSLTGLRQLLQDLTTVEGHKSLILVSEGLAIHEQGALASTVALAGRARTSINVLLVDLNRNDVTIAEQPPTEAQDRRIQMQGLELLATMSRGALYYVVGTGEPIFDRLASEISAHYVLGVEQRPSDAIGDRHRIDVTVGRRGVTVRSRQAFVVSTPAAAPRMPPLDSLREALFAPFPLSGVPLRVTTFAHQDPASDQVRLQIAAQVGQPGAAPAEHTVGFLLVDDQNRVVSSFGDTMTLSPAGASPNEPLQYLGGLLVDPGVYSLRFAAVDAEGRRGSVIRQVSAWKMTGEELAMGDLIVGPLPAPEGLRAAVEPHVSGDLLGAHLELYSTSAAVLDATAVTFEIGDDEDSPALVSVAARLSPGQQETWRVATGALALRALPPGRYVARAQIRRDGTVLGALARPFVVERPLSAESAVSPTAAAAAAISFADTLPRFDRQAALQPAILDAMLQALERRSAALQSSVAEARAGRYGPAALEALGAGDQAAAAFLRGLEFFVAGDLDRAATQLQIAAGERREFFPAAFYLGAAFAAAGRDRDAAGIWQMALGNEPRPPAVYAMVADARLRDGQPESAVDILQPAYARDPGDDEIGRRLGMAYVMLGRHADAVPVLDGYLARHPDDQDVLIAAILAQYESARAGQALSDADRAKLRRYAAAYEGPHGALVDKYLTTLGVR